MIADKKEFSIGVGMMAGFIAVLVIIFLPVFGGQDGLDYLDSLYNSISKGSAYYIPKIKEEAVAYNGKTVTVTLDFTDDKQARQTAMLFNQSGALVNVKNNQVKVTGDLGAILKQSLEDADFMYHNNGQAVQKRYGYNERQALYNWWSAFKAMDKDLKKQELFKEAKIVAVVVKKAVESAYNYYGIEPESISNKVGIVLFSLIFYVIYTLWYGFAILYMFEGWGLQLGH